MLLAEVLTKITTISAVSFPALDGGGVGGAGGGGGGGGVQGGGG